MFAGLLREFTEVMNDWKVNSASSPTPLVRRSTGSFALLPGEQLLPGFVLDGDHESAELAEDGSVPASTAAHSSELSRLKDPSIWRPPSPGVLRLSCCSICSYNKI